MAESNIKRIMKIDIDEEEDVILVFRQREGKSQDFCLHLPPFKGDEKNFPAHIGTAIAIVACLDKEDKDFFKFIGDKFNQYSKEYLTNLYSKKE